MVIYLATNQGRSPKAVSEAHSPEKRCSHLDIHKEKKGGEREKKPLTPPAIGAFIWILRRGEQQEDEIQEQREPAERREMAANQDATARWGIYASSYDPPAVTNLDASQQLMK